MSDDPNTRGEPDRSRINVNQEHELRYWTQALDVTEEELREAVRAVGASVSEVREYLRSR
ncbi:DUF3606 domain-containing protein [Lysobacter changpingensis]|jgi:hypothetical protein|uniref:DUF3606 domain-containing protein n=1 Tax=Lysobacter changpingensis TaxID=2792784 RepID=UPI001A8D0777|nr:DUF3606 domain-containing protein [Lysobacter changpingensis]